MLTDGLDSCPNRMLPGCGKISSNMFGGFYTYTLVNRATVKQFDPHHKAKTARKSPVIMTLNGVVIQLSTFNSIQN